MSPLHEIARSSRAMTGETCPAMTVGRQLKGDEYMQFKNYFVIYFRKIVYFRNFCYDFRKSFVNDTFGNFANLLNKFPKKSDFMV